eukprot:1194494-Amphidinium_carterae.1
MRNGHDEHEASGSISSETMWTQTQRFKSKQYEITGQGGQNARIAPKKEHRTPMYPKHSKPIGSGNFLSKKFLRYMPEEMTYV